MIWAILATYFLGGGLGGVNGSLLTSAMVKELSHKAETVIIEDDRAGTAQTIFKELRNEIRGYERKFARSGRQINRSYKDYEADKEKTLSILRDLNSDWETMQQRVIELRFELREQMTEQEWNELFYDSISSR